MITNQLRIPPLLLPPQSVSQPNQSNSQSGAARGRPRSTNEQSQATPQPTQSSLNLSMPTNEDSKGFNNTPTMSKSSYVQFASRLGRLAGRR